MKTTIGGDRLGSGNKQNLSSKNFQRSTHDLSSLWRSSMASGTLVPFMSELALPGDDWDINLNCEVLTLPTIGPLFGSYKVQLDVFQVPMRLYNAGLHMNRLGIGNDMSDVHLPQVKIKTNNHSGYVQTYADNEQINETSLMKYLGVSGLGHIAVAVDPAVRGFNAIPLLGYWEIFKNYYANKQEELAYVIHTDVADATITATSGDLENDGNFVGNILAGAVAHNGDKFTELYIQCPVDSPEPDYSDVVLTINANTYTLDQAFAYINWNDSTKVLECQVYKNVETTGTWQITTATLTMLGGLGGQIRLQSFNLSLIDDMREDILQHPFASGVFEIDSSSILPYSYPMKSIYTGADARYAIQYSQEGLAVKTYQSDLFNNWIDTEWIDGANGVNAVTSVDTSSGDFTIDALNLASKVYAMLNRIAISGGTYDDWLDAVYTHERSKSIESPVYHGSLIKELAFQEVISNADTNTADAGDQPLGTLAGRGKLTGKNKGGRMRIKVDEPSYIMGIVSITPRIEYSQGNKWDMNLLTMNDLHKPSLDAIGFQDLVTDQMCWTDTEVNSSTGVITYKSAGKQPAWLNYMTAVNRCYGNFAVDTKDMFMTLNRRYEKNTSGGAIEDLTTYIDPTKFNHIFAQTELDAQNFWVQISKNITARRKMSAKVIPNL